MRAAGGLDEAVSHQRAGGNDGFHDAGFDEVAENQAHFADGHRAGKGHDHETVFVARHGLENIGGIADLAGGEGGLAHGADEIVDGVDARKIERENGSETIFDRVVKDSSGHTLFLCHSASSQVM